MNKPRLSFIFCALFASLVAQQATPNYILSKSMLAFENGRTARQVTAGAQDSDGFVWLSTSYGLQRYDGKNFMLFTREKNGLQSNEAKSISESNDHLLWIQYSSPLGASINDGRIDILNTDGKVDILDLSTYRIRSFSEHFKNRLPFPENQIKTISANEKRELLIYVSEKAGPSLYLYTKTEGFRKLNKTEAISPCCPAMFRDDKILFGTWNHNLCLLSTSGTLNIPNLKLRNIAPLNISKTGKCYFHSLPLEEMGGNKHEFSPVIHELVGAKQALKLQKQFFDSYTQNLSAEFLYAFFDPLSGQSVLFSKSKGVFLFEEGNTIPLIEDVISSQLNVVYDYFTVNGQHWICTNNGVYRISLTRNFFSHYFDANSIDPGEQDNAYQTRSICEDSQGNLIVNCWRGLYKVKAPKSAKPVYEQLIPGKQTAYDGFYVDEDQNLWIGGRKNLRQQNYVTYNLRTGKTREYAHPAGDLWAAIRLGNKLLLGGFSTGLLVLENDSVKPAPLNSKETKPAWIYQFFKSIDKKLWMVCKNGLYEIDTATAAVKNRYASDNEANIKVPFMDIHYVHEDKKGNFWLATNGDGLICWNRNTNTFRTYSIDHGFSSNVIYAILEDKRGNLWLSSSYGIMCFNPGTERVSIYTKANGLSADECNRISYYKSASGRMYFGGINGVNAFDPEEMRTENTLNAAPLRLVSFQQFDGKQRNLVNKTQQLIQENNITLKPGDDFFNLEFQLLNYDEGKNYFAYKIEGLDRDWININENSLRISQLPYGEYTLHVKGRLQDGAWSPHMLVIPIRVLKPFYLSWWFISACALCVLFALIFIFRWRNRQLLKTKNELENLVTERTMQLKEITQKQEDLLREKDTLLKEIHHRVKNNLQVISALLEMQGIRSNDEKISAAISESQNRVLSISFIHQNLYQHDDLKGVEMQSFVKELSSHIHNVFKLPGCEVNTEIHVPPVFLDIDTALPLGLIMNELFTNSYKYAFNGKKSGLIQLELREIEKGTYLFRYHDNGPGLPPEVENLKSKSLGFKLIRQLSRQLGGTIRYVFEKGSTFELKLKDFETRNSELQKT
ncbi:MAG: hypothetical protein JNL60_17050 [Bacteroidia bacterium]|nr:hypothetical protein [Bacteroidia bacterium]